MCTQMTAQSINVHACDERSELQGFTPDEERGQRRGMKCSLSASGCLGVKTLLLKLWRKNYIVVW